MSHREPNDPVMHALPEESRRRLQQLHGHIALLARLVRASTQGEAPARALEIGPDELATCLALLGEQARMVLDDMARSSTGQAADAAGDRVDAAVGGNAGEGPATATSSAAEARGGADATAKAAQAGDAPVVFGMTLDQVDTLARLIRAIAAHGDVVASAHEAELAEATLPVLGQSIVDAAEAVRAILDEVERQRVGCGTEPRVGVREDRLAYGAAPTSAAARRRRRTRARRRPAMQRTPLRFGSAS